MEKIIERNLLFDFYGELLTKRQKEIYEDAVYGDMSLSELADNYGISRQGAHDFLKRCDKILMDCEAKLHLIEKSGNIRKACGDISKLLGKTNVSGESDKEINALLDEILTNL